MEPITLTKYEQKFLEQCASAEVITDAEGNAAILVGKQFIQIAAPPHIRNSLVPIIATALRGYKAGNA